MTNKINAYKDSSTDTIKNVDVIQVKLAAEVLHNNGLVAFPTETVYGLGALAFSALAVAKVFEVKSRPRFDPLIVHVPDLQNATILVDEFPNEARILAEKFWPGPLTLVLPKHSSVPDIVTAGLPTVAIRIPNHPIALELLQQTGAPIAAPSANRFGRVSPTTANHVHNELGDKVDIVLDGGPCGVGIESTIVSCIGGRITLLRPGGCSREDIENEVGPLCMPHLNSSIPLAPGMIPTHYAPGTPLFLKEYNKLEWRDKAVGLICLQPPSYTDGLSAIEVLSVKGDLREAAMNLFSALHRLDGLGLDAIIAQPFPNYGLGLAINDRLSRANKK